jgi:hypothetical protein
VAAFTFAQGELLLTFSAAEFAAFTETVNDCYRQQALRGDWAEAGSSNSILQVPTARLALDKFKR